MCKKAKIKNLFRFFYKKLNSMLSISQATRPLSYAYTMVKLRMGRLKLAKNRQMLESSWVGLFIISSLGRSNVDWNIFSFWHKLKGLWWVGWTNWTGTCQHGLVMSTWSTLMRVRTRTHAHTHTCTNWWYADSLLFLSFFSFFFFFNELWTQ